MLTSLHLVYSLILLLAAYIARRKFKYCYNNIAIGLLGLITIPIASFPGSQMPMYFVELVFPLFIFINIKNMNKIENNFYLRLAFFLYLFLPIISILWSLITWHTSALTWIPYLYRKFLIFSIILFSVINYKKLDVNEIFNSATLLWTLLCFLGIGHYLGFYYADLTVFDEDNPISGSIITNSWQIQQGFIGLNRGTTGVFSATFLSFSLGRLMYGGTSEKSKEKFVYLLCALSCLVILFFSGSRSGLIASVGAFIFTFIISFFYRRKLIMKYLVLMVIATIGLLIYLSTTTILDRFTLAASEDSGTSRLEIQGRVFENSFSGIQEFFIGNGTRRFSDLGYTLTHPHSDYFQALWDYGWLGLILYLFFLTTIFFAILKIKSNYDMAFFSAFAASLISGLTIGNLMIASSRLIVYVTFMILIYTVLYMKNKQLTK